MKLHTDEGSKTEGHISITQTFIDEICDIMLVNITLC